MKHFFDYYTINVRKRHQRMTEQLHGFGDANYNLFFIVREFLDAIDTVKDDESEKTVFKKENPQSNQTDSAYGFIWHGPYGNTKEVVEKDGSSVTTIKTTQAVQQKFFYYFYLPPLASTGLLIVHKIGNSGIASVLNNALRNHFLDATEGCTILIEPVRFNLTGPKSCSLKKLELILFEKPSGREKLKTGSVSGKTRSVGRFILEVGTKNKFLSKLLSSKDAKQLALDEIHPFIRIPDLANYTYTINGKVDIGGSKRTVQITNSFNYNTSENKTDQLVIVDGHPTIKSLLEEVAKSISMLKDKNVL